MVLNSCPSQPSMLNIIVSYACLTALFCFFSCICVFIFGALWFYAPLFWPFKSLLILGVMKLIILKLPLRSWYMWLLSVGFCSKFMETWIFHFDTILELHTILVVNADCHIRTDLCNYWFAATLEEYWFLVSLLFAWMAEAPPVNNLVTN